MHLFIKKKPFCNLVTMKKKITLTLLFFFPICFYGQYSDVDRLLTVRSKDSINGTSRLTGTLGLNLKLNGYYDVYGGLQDSETFNVGKIDVFGTDDSQSFKMDMYQTQAFIEGSYLQKKR